MPTRDVALARYQDALWELPVEVGGRTRRFLLDFGAGVTTLDARLADELGLREVGRVSGRRMHGERLELPLVGPADVGVGGIALTPRPLGRFDLAALLPPGWPRIDGVLALDVLEERPFAVDFARDRLQIGGVGDVRGLVPLRVRLFRQIPSVSLAVLVAVRRGDDPGDAGGADLWFELDNSNNGPVVVAPAAAGRLGIARRADVRDDEVHVAGLGAVRGPVAVRDIIYDGNLGRTFAAGRRFAFDLAAGRVWAAARPAGLGASAG